MSPQEFRMEEQGARQEFARGCAALDEGNSVAALAFLEKALALNDNPSWYSFLGYCIAKERGQFKKGTDLCQAAILHEPDNPVHYLHLGKVHLLAKQKQEALRVFREGMGVGGDEKIQQELERLGMRRPVVFPFLGRRHPLNRYLGQFLVRMGLR